MWEIRNEHLQLRKWRQQMRAVLWNILHPSQYPGTRASRLSSFLSFFSSSSQAIFKLVILVQIVHWVNNYHPLDKSFNFVVVVLVQNIRSDSVTGNSTVLHFQTCVIQMMCLTSSCLQFETKLPCKGCLALISYFLFLLLIHECSSLFYLAMHHNMYWMLSYLFSISAGPQSLP